MDDIHGLKPFLFFAPNWKLIALIVVAVVLALLLAGWLLRRRPAGPAPEQASPIVALPPRSVREQLQALAADGFADADRLVELHARLSALMRGYLGTRFGMPARRFTTTEQLAALARCGAPDEAQRLAASLFLQCDLVKFAEAQPDATDAISRFEEAQALVALLGDVETSPEPGPDEPHAAVAPAPETPRPAREDQVDVLG